MTAWAWERVIQQRYQPPRRWCVWCKWVMICRSDTRDLTLDAGAVRMCDGLDISNAASCFGIVTLRRNRYSESVECLFVCRSYTCTKPHLNGRHENSITLTKRQRELGRFSSLRHAIAKGTLYCKFPRLRYALPSKGPFAHAVDQHQSQNARRSTSTPD